MFNYQTFYSTIGIADRIYGIQMVRKVLDHLNTWPFDDQTCFDHSNTRHVRYSDPYCIGQFEYPFRIPLSECRSVQGVGTIQILTVLSKWFTPNPLYTMLMCLPKSIVCGRFLFYIGLFFSFTTLLCIVHWNNATLNNILSGKHCTSRCCLQLPFA
jgi:hypothetical protein